MAYYYCLASVRRLGSRWSMDVRVIVAAFNSDKIYEMCNISGDLIILNHNKAIWYLWNINIVNTLQRLISMFDSTLVDRFAKATFHREHTEHLSGLYSLIQAFLYECDTWKGTLGWQRFQKSLLHECSLNQTKQCWNRTWYCPSLLTCQMHTNYKVSAHDILIFEKCALVFVRCTDNNQRLDGCYSSTCGMHLTRTVIAQWSKAQVSHLMIVRSNQLGSRFCLHTRLNTAHTHGTTLLIVCLMFVCVFWFRITKQILKSKR